MPDLLIKTEVVDGIADSIGVQHEVIVDVLARLRGLNADLDGAWGGPAQDTFYDTYGTWITQLENYSETLSSVQGYLRSVAENFRQLDAAAQQAASGATLAD